MRSPRSKVRRREPRRWVLALLGLAVLVAIGYGLSLAALAVNGIPGASYYHVNAVFANADNLVKHNKVRVNGVFVGQISGTHIDGTHAVVELQLDKKLEPLKSGSRVRIRPQSAVGTRFLELYPSRTGTPLADGGTIPLGQTRGEVPLDTVLSQLDRGRRARLHTLLNELGTGMAGRGDDLNAALQDIPPALHDFASVARAIDDDGGLAPFVRGTQGAAAAADPVRFDIADGFDPEQRTLQPFVTESASVQRALDVAPDTLRTARAGLRETSPLLRALDGFTSAATPALVIGRGALTSTSALLRDGRPGLRAVPVTLPLLRPATPATLGALKTLRPVLPRIDAATAALNPVLTELAPRECDLQTWTHNWASATSWGDENSNFLRFDLVAPDQTSLSSNGGSGPGIFRDAYPEPCEAPNQKPSR
jgi:virulence factor Mce-like protein